jgi:hypothetical protein
MVATMTSKRHAKPTAQTLAERSYRHVLALRTTLLNQMALIRLDIVTARREDREHMKTLADHCARLLREKETLQRRLYAVQELKANPLQWPLPWPDGVVPPQTTIHSHEPGKPCTEYCKTIPTRPQL